MHELAMGYMGADAFLQFLGKVEGVSANASTVPDAASSASLWVALGTAFFGGLALNLTPCVLPMLPVNIILIGRGFRRGLFYGAGIACAYGALGIAAAFFGLPFGSLLGKAWFSFAVAAVFAVLALGMVGVFRVDFTRFRRRSGGGTARLAGLFGLGAMSAVLAGACVAPVALAALVETASRVTQGERAFIALPFALGLGMSAPYPFLAAGFAKLPRPGSWMRTVNVVFACVLGFFAVKYALAGADLLVGGKSGTEIAATETGTGMEDGAKPVLYVIGAPWCGYCRQMEATTLKEARVLEALKNFEVKRIEVDDFDELRLYTDLKPLVPKIQGVPAYVIVKRSENR